MRLDTKTPPTPLDPIWSARLCNTRHYTNVVCYPDMLNAIVSPRTRGSWPGALPPAFSIVSDPSTLQAEPLALLR